MCPFSPILLGLVQLRLLTSPLGAQSPRVSHWPFMNPVLFLGVQGRDRSEHLSISRYPTALYTLPLTFLDVCISMSSLRGHQSPRAGGSGPSQYPLAAVPGKAHGPLLFTPPEKEVYNSLTVSVAALL